MTSVENSKKMLVTIMGCGTSVGAPMIGMQGLPQFQNPKNHRMRASLLVQPAGERGPAIVIDTAPDFRVQALRYFPQQNPRLDAVLISHSHADHLHGLDDIRPFNFMQKEPIPLFSDAGVLKDIRQKFSYIFEVTQEGGGKPRLELREIDFEKPFHAAGVEIIPLHLIHGTIPTLGFRIGPLAYLTDCSYIPDQTIAKLDGLELLILDCLRPKPHTTHLHVEASLEYARRIRAKHTVFTHMGFELEYEEFKRSLPAGMEPAYDGMKFEL
jgi:phosphoribosyl 1,2-cyclic phosphate phosphodiesterase